MADTLALGASASACEFDSRREYNKRGRMRAISDSETTRKCKDCGEWKEISHYSYREKERRNIRRSCKVCQNKSTNFHKKVYKAIHDLTKRLAAVEDRVVVDLIVNDPEIRTLVKGRVGPKRFDALVRNEQEKVISESLINRMEKCERNGWEKSEARKVWNVAVHKMGFDPWICRRRVPNKMLYDDHS